MRAIIAILLILLVTYLFFHTQINTWFSEQGITIRSKVTDNFGRHTTYNGVQLKYYGSISLVQAVPGDLLQMDLANSTVNISGSATDQTDLLIGYWEFAPGDASFSIDATGLVSRSKSGKPVLITSVDGSIPEKLSLNIASGNGEIKVGTMSGIKEISIDTGNGAVEAEACSAEKLVLSTGNGAISIKDCQTARAKVDTGNGAITVIDSQIDYLDAETGLGDITLQNSQIKDKRLDTGMGNILER